MTVAMLVQVLAASLGYLATVVTAGTPGARLIAVMLKILSFFPVGHAAFAAGPQGIVRHSELENMAHQLPEPPYTPEKMKAYAESLETRGSAVPGQAALNG